LLSGFSVGTRNVGGIDISHLLFAIDTLIFCEADLDRSSTSFVVLILMF
jgi:hypothetical protein